MLTNTPAQQLKGLWDTAAHQLLYLFPHHINLVITSWRSVHLLFVRLSGLCRNSSQCLLLLLLLTLSGVIIPLWGTAPGAPFLTLCFKYKQEVRAEWQKLRQEVRSGRRARCCGHLGVVGIRGLPVLHGAWVTNGDIVTPVHCLNIS